MQKLKNIGTGAEYVITGSIGVPREIDENTFEVWTHFSVDLDGDGQIDTIEVHPESTEWEVIDVPEPVVEPEPELTPEPTPTPTPDELAQAEAQAEATRLKAEWLKNSEALDKMIEKMEKGKLLGIQASEAQLATMTELANWVNANMKKEYFF